MHFLWHRFASLSIAFRFIGQSQPNTEVVRSEIEQKISAFRVKLDEIDYYVHEDSYLYVDRNEFLNSVMEELNCSDAFEYCTFRCEYLNIVYLNELGMDGGGLRRDFFTQASHHFFDPSSPSGLFGYVEGNDAIHVTRSLVKLTPLKKKQYIAAGMLLGLALVHGEWFGLEISKLLFYAILYDEQDLQPPLELLHDQIDSAAYQSFISIRDQTIDDSWDLVFEYKGEQLLRKGRSIAVTEKNKKQFLRKIFVWYVYRNRSEQLKMLRKGFYRIVDRECIVKFFTPSDLSILLSGRPEIQVEDWRAHTSVRNEHLAPDLVEDFWTFVESLDQRDRSRLLQFVTGSSSLPPEGFAGLRKRFKLVISDILGDSSLPTACTCKNRLSIPHGYQSYSVLSQKLRMAMDCAGDEFSLQ